MELELLPISCISCRKRKIKCNKQMPCNQCTKRGIRCEFPLKFRNTPWKQDYDTNQSTNLLFSDFEQNVTRQQYNQYPTHASSQGSSSGRSYQNVPADLSNQLKQLQDENKRLVEQNSLLRQLLNGSNKDFSGASATSTSKDSTTEDKQGQNIKSETNEESSVPQKVDKQEESSNDSGKILSEEACKQQISINGETTELGEKYYGPQSSRYMIDSLKNLEISGNSTSETTSKRQHDEISPAAHDRSFLNNSSQSNTEQDSIDLEKATSKPEAPASFLEKSFTKKKLPAILYDLIKYNDANKKETSQTYKDLSHQNLKVIIELVNRFFESNQYYETFISRASVLDFLNEYELIEEKDWENDDDLLLLNMMLVLSIQKLTPQEFVDLELLPESAKIDSNKFKEILCERVLVHEFDKLRHNLINESIRTIQSYILNLEWLFTKQKYEESWSMVFHSLSISYAIGIHIQGKFRTSNPSISESEENKEPTANNDEDDVDVDADVARYKVWFALKYLTGQVCSTLGRPNPISIHANMLVLQSNLEADSEVSTKLEETKSQVALKIGLSELLRLSNIKLTKSYMDNFLIRELLDLDLEYAYEIKTLQSFYDDNSMNTEIKYDKYTHLPVSIDSSNILMDLIVLHVNRAKLFEPFINDFENSDDYDLILNNLITSVLSFSDLTYIMLEKFLEVLLEKYNQKESNIYTSHTIRFGRYFRTYYPFLNSSIYQGIVVIFTFLHYKFKNFVRRDGSALFNSDFLDRLETSLTKLITFDENVSDKSNKSAKVWNNQISYLINKILKTIEAIRENQKEFRKLNSETKRYKGDSPPSSSGGAKSEDGFQDPFESNIFEYHPGDTYNTENNPETSDFLNNLYNFYYSQLQDPFWMTSGENIPYYLSSPSEDDDRNAIYGSIRGQNEPTYLNTAAVMHDNKPIEIIPDLGQPPIAAQNWEGENLNSLIDSNRQSFGFVPDGRAPPGPTAIHSSLLQLKLERQIQPTISSDSSQSALSLQVGVNSNNDTPQYSAPLNKRQLELQLLADSQSIIIPDNEVQQHFQKEYQPLQQAGQQEIQQMQTQLQQQAAIEILGQQFDQQQYSQQQFDQQQFH